MVSYHEVRQRWESDPVEFWRQAANQIEWINSPKEILDETQAPLYRWYPDGVLNTCANALDRHVASGRGEQVAIDRAL